MSIPAWAVAAVVPISSGVSALRENHHKPTIHALHSSHIRNKARIGDIFTFQIPERHAAVNQQRL